MPGTERRRGLSRAVLGGFQFPGHRGPAHLAPRPPFRLALTVPAPLGEREGSQTRHTHEGLTVLAEAVLTDREALQCPSDLRHLPRAAINHGHLHLRLERVGCVKIDVRHSGSLGSPVLTGAGPKRRLEPREVLAEEPLELSHGPSIECCGIHATLPSRMGNVYGGEAQIMDGLLSAD